MPPSPFPLSCSGKIHFTLKFFIHYSKWFSKNWRKYLQGCPRHFLNWRLRPSSDKAWIYPCPCFSRAFHPWKKQPDSQYNPIVSLSSPQFLLWKYFRMSWGSLWKPNWGAQSSDSWEAGVWLICPLKDYWSCIRDRLLGHDQSTLRPGLGLTARVKLCQCQ